MADHQPCPVCRAATRATTIPVRVERGGREVLRLLVPARACVRCEHVQIADEVTEEVVATLEQHTEPGDDIVFPGGGPTVH
jgi:hypothetical protein